MKKTHEELMAPSTENTIARVRAERFCSIVPDAAIAEMEFGDVLELERTFFGRSYQHLDRRDEVFAQLHGVTSAAMAKYISGNGNPDPRRALEFCRSTGIDIAKRWMRLILTHEQPLAEPATGSQLRGKHGQDTR